MVDLLAISILPWSNGRLTVMSILQCKQWQTKWQTSTLHANQCRPVRHQDFAMQTMTQTWQSLAYVLCKTTTDWWCVAVTSVVLCNDKLEQAVLSSNNNDRLVVLSNRTSPFMAPTEDQQRKFDLTQLAAAWPTQQFCVLAETTWRCWSYLSDLQHDAC